MKKNRYLTAKEAASELSISLSTLYAYVSRGQIRSEEGGGSKRDRLYHGEDIERLKARKEARRNPERVAKRALHTGEPVLESAITLITDDCVYYRGQNALTLAKTESIERVAALIWTGNLDADLAGLRDDDDLSPRCWEMLNRIEDLKPVERFQALLPVAGSEDLAAYDLRPEAVVQAGARILRFLTGVAVAQKTGEGIAKALQKVWAPDLEDAVGLINAVLILFADHELNISAFSARCAASAGATPYGAVSAGLAALQGYKHGAASERTEAVFREAEALGDVERTIVERLRRGEGISGFGHAVYRDVDPRGVVLLEQIEAYFPDSKDLTLAREIIDVTHRLTSVRFNVDLALVVLVRVLGMPEGSAMTLFALGRTVGWVGHAIEQYEVDQLIRPRAKYIGLQPVV